MDEDFYEEPVSSSYSNISYRRREQEDLREQRRYEAEARADLEHKQEEIRKRAKKLFLNGKEHFLRHHYEEAQNELSYCVYEFDGIGSYYYLPNDAHSRWNAEPHLTKADQQFLDDAKSLLSIAENCYVQIGINEGLEQVKQYLCNYNLTDALNKLQSMRSACSSITNIQDVVKLNYIPVAYFDSSISILKNYIEEWYDRQKNLSKAVAMAVTKSIDETRHIGGRDYVWLTRKLQQLFNNHWKQLDQCDLTNLKKQIVDFVIKKVSKRPCLQFLLGEYYIPDYRKLGDGIECTIHDNLPQQGDVPVWLPILGPQDQQPVFAIVVDNHSDKEQRYKSQYGANVIKFVLN